MFKVFKVKKLFSKLKIFMCENVISIKILKNERFFDDKIVLISFVLYKFENILCLFYQNA